MVVAGMDIDIDTRQPAAVELVVQTIFSELFPEADPVVVHRSFCWALDCFSGRFRDFQPIDVPYHDLEHTLQGTLCFARLLQGRHRAAVQPAVTVKLFELGLLAVLLHDTGYLKKATDQDGTGAKYTLTHVARGMEFARHLLTEKGFSPSDIATIENIICCTGVNADLKTIPFQNEVQRSVGYCVGTADLLGQMAAKDYIEKLPLLYAEFAESADYNRGRGSNVGAFPSLRDLFEKTPLFWEKYVLPKVTKDFEGVFRFLNSPYPDGSNSYLSRIEANIQKLRDRLAAGQL